MKVLKALRQLSRSNIDKSLNKQKKRINEHHYRVYKAHHQHTVECLKEHLHSLKEQVA